MNGMLGISMFFVGAILYLNGLWLLGKIEARAVAVFNLLVGLLCAIMALQNHFTATALSHHLATANSLLFAFTYLAVAFNCFFDLPGEGLGWFSLYVAVATIPNMVYAALSGDLRFGFIWLLWGILWFCFFLSLVCQMSRIKKILPYLSIFIGLVSAGIPGYLMLWGYW